MTGLEYFTITLIWWAQIVSLVLQALKVSLGTTKTALDNAGVTILVAFNVFYIMALYNLVWG